MTRILAIFLLVVTCLGHSFVSHGASVEDVKETQSPAEISNYLSRQTEELIDYYFAAARVGDLELMEAFRSSGISLNLRNHKGYTPLMVAAYNGQEVMVDYLLQYGADACAEDKRGNTALMAAVFRGELRISKRLISADCNPDQTNKRGMTAAMFAALFGREDVLLELKKRGADLSKKDMSGSDAASLAAGQGNRDLSELIESLPDERNR
ncbi:ankyrin repeat domain-containing protein [Hahella ganghwensis]|uniref:ankyrin repeat domain-containing protein n=1 Tax=Hahella ganghwensis TaxID=286420 RepID=UPI000381A39A|nr:ankyrin repeat domain-containing protein [Hahella ganghwensis]